MIKRLAWLYVHVYLRLWLREPVEAITVVPNPEAWPDVQWFYCPQRFGFQAAVMAELQRHFLKMVRAAQRSRYDF